MIGRHLDKYEILEEVGQGGMSVVYKGRDTVLRRDVAIKVLHPHLASHEEARVRFEREAQAVAKLRHDNILEIFDYSGKGSQDSYIVTEFIRGRTLRDFTAAHRLAFPEIAAMIVGEIARALVHAHKEGVLHRDIKPENVMVREDGRLKLMDFGIAQVVDAQRMTVTGQLLGSPAYMSPEHVEGKPLDFRTDLFSLGILLYQLATGELPFKGKNPHEILKKIAECQFLDARIVNPLVGERLGKIIARSLAREPADRYPEISVFLDELNRYLAEAELTDPREELTRFFATPVAYEQALKTRLVSALTRSGKTQLAAKRTSAALELFNRVLTIDPTNEVVLAEIDRLSARKRLARGAVLACGLAALGGAVVAYRSFAGATDVAVASDAAPSRPDAGRLAERPPPRLDAAPAVVPPDAAPERTPVVVRPDPGPEPQRPVDAGAALPGRTILLSTYPKAAEYSLDNGPWTPVAAGGRARLELAPGPHVIGVRNPLCKPERREIAADDPAENVVVTLSYLPRLVRFACPAADKISLDNRTLVPPGREMPIDFTANADERRLTVTFTGPNAFFSEKQVTIRPGTGPQDVRCDEP